MRSFIQLNTAAVRELRDRGNVEVARLVLWPLLSDAYGGRRRIIMYAPGFTPGPLALAELRKLVNDGSGHPHPHNRGFCPYGRPGSRLRVGEAWRPSSGPAGVSYRVDYNDGSPGRAKWRAGTVASSRFVVAVKEVRIVQRRELSELLAAREDLPDDPLLWWWVLSLELKGEGGK